MQKMTQLLLIVLLLAGALVAVLVLVSPQSLNWGSLSIAPSSTITVTGTAETQVNNQIAQFTAGVNAISDQKEPAMDEVNTKIQALITAVKEFGIEDKDIQTQSVSVTQEEQFDPNTRRSSPGQWRAQNTLTITLRDITKASALTQVLTESGATNVYGPNFSIDNSQEAEVELAGKAIDQARQKAEKLAQASGKTLGDVITINESGSVNGPIPFMDRGLGGGGGAPLEPGSTSLSHSVTVTFELK
jgi:uncharacterized protein YggE